MTDYKNKLAVIMLGNQNAGKSNTWYKLFNKEKVRTQRNLRPLYFNAGEYTDVFLLNGSMEERNEKIEEKLINCNILLCSVQYNKKGKKTIEYLHNQGYQIYVYWLNPGCDDKYRYTDYLKIIEMVLSYPNSIVNTCKAIPDDNDTKKRSTEILKFVYKWATEENLVTQQ
jgi:hypothetical protein